MESKLLKIQYLRKKGLLTEQQKDNDSVVKKSLLDIGVILDGTFTFGTGITAFLPIVRDLINLEQPQITEQSIILVYITAMWVILNRHQDKVKKLLQIIREQGLGDAFNRVVDFLKSLEDVVLKVADEVGYAASNIADVGAFTFLAFPLLDGLVALINSGDISLGEPSGYLKSVLISIGILSVKNIFNNIIRSIKSKFGTLEESRRILRYNDCGISDDVSKVINKTLFTESPELWILPEDVNSTNEYKFLDKSHQVQLHISRNVKLKEDYVIDIKENKSDSFTITLTINPISEPKVYKDIKLTLKECFGKWGYSPISLTLSEQTSNTATRKVYEDEEVIITVPLTQESFCELAKGTEWCKPFTGKQWMGTYYIIYNKKNNEKTLVHDTRRVFLLREPSNGHTYNVYDKTAYNPWTASFIKKILSKSPELIEFFKVNYTPSDLIKYNMDINPKLLEEYSHTNEFAKAVYKIIKDRKNFSLDEIRDILEPYLGKRTLFAEDYTEVSGDNEMMMITVYGDSIDWSFPEPTYEDDILNIGSDGDGWYYSMAMDGTTTQHDEMDEEELNYICHHYNEPTRQRLVDLFTILEPDAGHRLDNICEDGLINDMLEKYFAEEWHHVGGDIIWELSQGVGEYRRERLKENIEKELTMVAKSIPAGYELEVSYPSLLSIIHQYDLKTFDDILDSGFNEMPFSLYEAWQDEWGFGQETGEEINKLMNDLIDDIDDNEEFDVGERKKSFDVFSKIIKDLGFGTQKEVYPYGTVFDKELNWGEGYPKVYARVGEFKPTDSTVTLSLSLQPFSTYWGRGHRTGKEDYKLHVNSLSDYVNSPNLFFDNHPEMLSNQKV